MRKKLLKSSLFILCTFSTELPHTELAGKIVDHVGRILQSAGSSAYIGEGISQLAHAEQAAEQASLKSRDQEVIIAALLHDLGHRLKHKPAESMNGYGAKDHETIGADYLQQLGFSTKVYTMIKEHARAKRYLARDYQYYQALSEASKQTLVFQGGIMTDDESRAFEQQPFFEECTLLRHCDDAAKDISAVAPSFTTYRTILVKYLESEFKKDPRKLARVLAFTETQDFKNNS